ncbi:MAG TPA: phage holin family protein, partial [Polyangia bacterium]|nr:phage holin family protein [Polyangia bacterium]
MNIKTKGPMKEPHVLALLKELVDALGELVGGHLRLARAEIGGDARRLVRRAALVSLAAAFGLVGYALACVAAALALAPILGAPLAFVALGGVHLLGASVGLGVLLGRPPHRPLEESFAALGETVRTVQAVGAAALAP